MKQRGSMLSLLIVLVVFVLAAASPASAAVSVSGYVLTLVKWEDKICCHELPRLGLTSVPLKTSDGGPKELDHNQFSIDTRQTRFWVAWTDDVQGIKMSGRIEMDFNSTDGNALTSNSRHLRLRIAHARADHPAGFFIIAGQTYSIVNTQDIAFTGKYAVDEFNSAPGSQSGWRQPAIQGGWTTKMPVGSLTLAASVEKNSAPNLGSTLVDESQGEGQETPAFGAQVTWDSPIVRLRGAGLVAKETETFTGGSQTSKQAWIVNADVEVKPIAGLTIFGHVYTEKGLGRSIGGAGEFPSLGVDAANKIVLIKAKGYYVGVAFVPPGMPTTQFDVYYGWQKADQEPSIGFSGNSCPTVSGNPSNSGACLKEHQGIFANVRQRFWQNWLLGVEYKHFNVKTFGGAKGDADFIEGAIYYFF